MLVEDTRTPMGPALSKKINPLIMISLINYYQQLINEKPKPKPNINKMISRVKLTKDNNTTAFIIICEVIYCK